MNQTGTVFIQSEEDRQEKEATKKLVELADQSTILFETQSIFPFQIFPDKVIVETDKVTLIHRTFAWKNIFPILVTNLKSVNVNRSLILASISFQVTGYENNPADITHLWPKDAAYIKRLIMGLIYAHQEGVDISKIPTSELKDNLEKIGTTSGDSETLPMR